MRAGTTVFGFKEFILVRILASSKDLLGTKTHLDLRIVYYLLTCNDNMELEDINVYKLLPKYPNESSGTSLTKL